MICDRSNCVGTRVDSNTISGRRRRSITCQTSREDTMAAQANNSSSQVLRHRFRWATLRSSHWSRAQTRAVLGALTAAIALVLLIAHGLRSSSFVVDTTSLGLLAFVSLPFLSMVLTSFKAGG